MGYPRRGNLPATKEDKLIYELVSCAVNDLHQGITRLAMAQHTIEPHTLKQRRVHDALEGINEKLVGILDQLHPERDLEQAVGALVGYDPATLTFEENNDG
tara:strand:+ start:486 stop:788 length:303 start_codon:yes stop_codon:yes gene_type:complete